MGLDKNKGEAPLETGPVGTAGRPPGMAQRTDLVATLHVLGRDLDRLLAFLDTYERSDHPERAEALRWLQPIVDRHLRALKRHRHIAEKSGHARR